MDPATILVAVVGAMVYSLSTYFSQRVGDDPESFDPRKFVRAVIIGLVVGVYAAVRGLELDMASYRNLSEAAGVTVVADQLTKLVWRSYKRWRA